MVTCPPKQLGQQEACFARHTTARHAADFFTDSLGCASQGQDHEGPSHEVAVLLSWPGKLKLTRLHSMGQQTKSTMALRSLLCSDFRIFATRCASTCFGLKRISRHLRDTQTTPYLRILSLLSQPGQTSRKSLLARNKARKDIHLQTALQTPSATPLSLSEGGVAQEVLLRRTSSQHLGRKTSLQSVPKRLMAGAKTRVLCSS